MAEKKSFLEQLGGWANILRTIIALVALFGGGSLFYTEVIQQKELAYRVMSQYEVNGQVINAIVVENRGNVPLTDIQIVIRGLSADIVDISTSGIHERATITDGGQPGDRYVTIEMERLSVGKDLPFHIITGSSVELEESNILVTSLQKAGEKYVIESNINTTAIVGIVVAAIAIGIMIGAVIDRLIRAYREKRKIENERGLVREFIREVEQ